MKPLIAVLLGLGGFLGSPGLAEEVKPTLKANRTSLDFSKHLAGPAKWELGTAVTLSLKMDGDSTVFLQNSDHEVYRLNAPEYIAEALLSEDGKSLIFRVMKTRGFGADFATLLRVQAVASEMKCSRVLEDKQTLFEGRRWWLSELGAVSNDGETLLGKFGVSGLSNTSRISYIWYTLEVSTGKILSEGLSMANSKPSIPK